MINKRRAMLKSVLGALLLPFTFVASKRVKANISELSADSSVNPEYVATPLRYRAVTHRDEQMEQFKKLTASDPDLCFVEVSIWVGGKHYMRAMSFTRATRYMAPRRAAGTVELTLQRLGLIDAHR